MAACFALISGVMISGASADDHGRKKREHSHKRGFAGTYQMPAM